MLSISRSPKNDRIVFVILQIDCTLYNIVTANQIINAFYIRLIIFNELLTTTPDLMKTSDGIFWDLTENLKPVVGPCPAVRRGRT